MHVFSYDAREKRNQRRRAKAAFHDYARNGWQCPWMRKNSLIGSVFRR